MDLMIALYSSKLLTLLIVLLQAVNPIFALSDKPLLLVISLDGFRYDLLNSTLVPTIWQFAQQGVRFKNGCKPQYLSYTLPNHVSLSTGLLAQHHGIVGNVFNDPVSGQKYDLYNQTRTPGIVNASLAMHFYNGEPIWLSNERAGGGRRSASVFWPAGDAFWPTPPHRPSFFKTWTENHNLTHWKSDFDSIIDLYTRPVEPYNFVAWYISEPDHTLHVNGFRNGEIEKTLRSLDLLIDYVVQKLKNQSELAKRLNIILTSDHGHAQVEGPSNVFCISQFISMDGVKLGDHMLSVDDPDRKKFIYDKLTKAIEEGKYGINLYLKENFPKEFGYAENARVGDIIIEPKPGYTVHPFCKRGQYELQSSTPEMFHQSSHGMDPNHWTMKFLLTMKGPIFKSEHQIDKVANNIDLYSLMCYILDVIPAPNNGTLDNLYDAINLKASHQAVTANKMTIV